MHECGTSRKGGPKIMNLGIINVWENSKGLKKNEAPEEEILMEKYKHQ
jgi:hypothetical protein